MKKLIYQVYVGPKSKLYDMCTATVKEYADRICADYICQRELILKIKPNPFRTNRSKEAVSRVGCLPIYEKENAFDYLDKYDAICIIDSDVYIKPNAPSIFEELKDNDFCGVIEATMPLTPEYQRKIFNYSHMQYQHIAGSDWKKSHLGYDFYNMGIMLFGNNFKKYLKGQTAKEFLARPEFADFIDGIGAWKWSTDQTLLNWWIRKSGMKHKGIDWKFNGLYTANTRIKECHFIHFFLRDKLHNKGENIEQLIKQIFTL